MQTRNKYFEHPSDPSLDYCTLGGRLASCIKTTNNANPTSFHGWRSQGEFQSIIDKIKPEDAIQVYFQAREIAANKPHRVDYFGENNLSKSL